MPLPRPSLHGLCVVLVASLMAPPVAAKKPKKPDATRSEGAGTPAQTASSSRPLDPDMPDAGDESIPDEPLEPGQIQPGLGKATGKSAKPGASVGISSRKPNIGSDQLAAQFDMEASERFDAGDYREAARLWVKALEALSENQSNHVTRSAMLLNAVTAYEQLFVESGDVELLNRAQLVISDYLRACKKRYGSACDRYPETAEARKRLEEVMTRISEAAPKVKKIPPEIDTAPGGRPFNRMVKLPTAPAWIGPAFAVGVALAGGGAGLAYWARTDPRFDPVADDAALSTKIAFREGEDTGADTGEDTGTDTAAALQTVELAPEVKGDLATVAGVFMAAAGVGLIVLASVKLAKHRRINRERASVLSLVPAVSPAGGGLGLYGRF